jgi:ankyrin repeat protein
MSAPTFPLHEAATARNLPALLLALRAGFPVDHANGAGVTALMCSALVGCAETTEALLEAGASVGYAHWGVGSQLR